MRKHMIAHFLVPKSLFHFFRRCRSQTLSPEQNNTHIAFRQRFRAYCASHGKTAQLPLYVILVILLSGPQWPTEANSEDSFGCLIAPHIYIDSISHPGSKNRSVYLLSPDSRQSYPVVFFCHGIGASHPGKYDGFLSKIIEHGSAVIFSPYNASPVQPKRSYRMMWEGFEKAVKTWGAILDTTRVGFVGHSFGGGAIPGLAHKALTQNGWGSDRSFLYIMAPWFSYWIDEKRLVTFPSDTRLVMQVFEADNVNDPRIALDIFNSIGIPADKKKFISTYNLYDHATKLEATHDLPMGKCFSSQPLDSLSKFGFSSILGSLGNYISKRADSLFPAETLSRETPYWGTTYGNTEGSVFVPSDTFFFNPEISYINFQHHAMNPRAAKTIDIGNFTLKSRVKTTTTLSNYLWYFLFPKLHKGKGEEQLNRFTQWEDDIELRDTATYSLMIQQRRRKFPTQLGPIVSGYGARGPFGVVKRFVPNSGEGRGKLYFYIPQGKQIPCPVIYFAPAQRTSARKYNELFYHLASQGYILIASSGKYSFFPNHRKRCKELKKEFDICNTMLMGMIDTTRIGFIGHGQGASTILPTAGSYLSERQWGAQGAFLFLMAPRKFEEEQKAACGTLPPHARVIVQSFDRQPQRRRRQAQEMFDYFASSDSQKFFLLAHSFGTGFHRVEADGHSPLCEKWDEDLNCIDDYAIFRPVSYLAKQCFKLDSAPQTRAFPTFLSVTRHDAGSWKAFTCAYTSQQVETLLRGRTGEAD